MSKRARFRTPAEAFDARVERSADGCWLWRGYVDAKGYGVIGIGGRKLVKVHRYSYTRFIGAIPPGLQLDHLCRVRSCVNPAHLEPVTNAENVRRGFAARPQKSSCTNGHDYTPDNTFINARGDRECRVCRAATFARRKERLYVARH